MNNECECEDHFGIHCQFGLPCGVIRCELIMTVECLFILTAERAYSSLITALA